ncbi:MAG: MATE family efflux transporter [Spirochaetales bacterium]|nr:MATE family efflux transporter [Spirochaetales bacterium]
MDKNRLGTLTSGRVTPLLLKLSFQMMVGMLGMVIFNLVDTYFVGQLGTEELAAMGFTQPIVLLQAAISMGLGVGAASVISHLIGQGDHAKVQRQTTDSLILTFLIVLVVVIAGIFSMDILFSAMGAHGHVLDLVKEYMFIWYLGVACVVIPMVGNNAIRAAGNTLIPSIIMLIAIVVNIVLDPLLIFGIPPFPRMGLQGAALATVVARATTLVCALLFLRFRFDMLTFKIPRLRELLASWKRMLFIGIPAAISQAILPLSMGIIIKIVAGYGPSAVAALGVGVKIEFLALAPIRAISTTLIPFIGQNLGAGNMKRIRAGIKTSHVFSILLGLLLFIIFFFFGKSIASIFNEETDIINYIQKYLIIASIGYGALGVFFINVAAFNALKKPLHSVLANVVRFFVLYIPLALICSKIMNLEGVFWGASMSSILGGIFIWGWHQVEMGKIERRFENAESEVN